MSDDWTLERKLRAVPGPNPVCTVWDPVVHGQAGASRKYGCGLVPSPTGRYERELSMSCAISTKFTLGFTP
jgi:hypothetical protein